VTPCRCRGSMAGVHASCVEAWVRCHRQDAQFEPPHCPVCKMEYGGSEQRPGLRALAVQLSKSLARQLLRTASEAVRFVLLATLLVQYCPEDNDDEEAEPPALKVLVAVALAAFLLHKFAVLSVSLPPMRAPPAGRLARCFFTADLWCTARHVAESLAVVVLLGARCAYGELPLAYYLPVAAGALAPFALLLLWYSVGACVKEVALFAVFLFCAPVLAVVEVGRLAWRHRHRLVNPLDGPLHIALGMLAVILCLGCRSLQPATVLFTAHATLLALGLLERLALRRLPWRSGRAWWCAVLVAVEATNLALGRWWLTLLLLLVALRSLQRAAARPRPEGIFNGPLWWCTLLVIAEATSLGLREVRGGPPARAAAAGRAAVLWLGLISGLACTVNWRRGLRLYRGWQRQHATFVLCAPVLAAGSGAGTPVRAETDYGEAADVV